MSLPSGAQAWRDGGRMVQTRAGSVFVRTGAGEGPPVLLLHGYPSSSYDFRHVVRGLGGRAWVTLDFLGFGLSEKPRPHTYSLFEQADLVEEVVAEVVGSTAGRVQLVAHDMGTSVATELLARDLEGRRILELDTVVLSNGSVILERASLRPIQRVLRGPFGPLVARLSNRRMFTRELSRVFSAQHPLSAQEAADQWALLAADDGHRIIHLLTAYLHERVEHADRWHGAVADWDGRLGFLWGLEDPVATTDVLQGLRELRPAAEVVELPGVGHYPQLEDPAGFADGVLRLLGQGDGQEGGISTGPRSPGD